MSCDKDKKRLDLNLRSKKLLKLNKKKMNSKVNKQLKDKKVQKRKRIKNDL